MSTTEIFLDAKNLLPLAIVYSEHPDEDAGTDIPVEIRFSDYKSVNGFLLPLRIQKLVNGAVTLELQIESATFNAGLQQSDFKIQ